MIPRRDPVTGGSERSRLLGTKAATNSANICETDLPRCAASAFACSTSTSSNRNVSFVFMTYTFAQHVRLVNHLPANAGRLSRACERNQQAVVRSELLLQFFAHEFAVPENPSKETAANRLAAVDGNNGTAAVGMAEEVMADSNANEIEPKTTQCLEEVRAGDCRKRAHAMTATR